MTFKTFVNGLNIIPVDAIIMPVMIKDGEIYYPDGATEIVDAFTIAPHAKLRNFVNNSSNLSQGDTFIVPVGRTAYKKFGKSPSYSQIMFYIDLGQGSPQTMIADIRKKAMLKDITNFALPLIRCHEPFCVDQTDIVKIMIDEFKPFATILNISIVVDVSQHDAYKAFTDAGYNTNSPLL